MPDLFPRSTDPSLWHPLLVQRWAMLAPALATAGIRCVVWEGYRTDERQGWLWAQGRSAADCVGRGINPVWARPGDIVTNAWSAKVGPHGHVQPLCTVDHPDGIPASCAIDVVPIGLDGRPWTSDDDWDKYVALTVDPGSIGWKIGLIHFHSPGKQVWDKPHLQLREWSDLAHDLIIGA